MSDWVPVFRTGDNLKAELVKTFLIDEGINAIIVNKIDSAYPIFGMAEVHCRRDQVVLAINLLENKYHE
ncbi:MAG: DUF2007 domain-containing protein [Bacteroidetes bacterium]|nr:DUF2007 domain-containing protein [Bacteroidota bacterium]MCK6610584.1 DUF2007 domain-containing protein [Bacteroidia bacterium]